MFKNQEHVKVMTEVFDALSVVGDPLTEEDRVVFRGVASEPAGVVRYAGDGARGKR